RHRSRCEYFVEPFRDLGGRSQHAGASEAVGVGANQHLALVGGAGGGREPFAVKLGLVHERVACVAPRLLLAVGEVNHPAVDDAEVRGILAGSLQRFEVDANFAAAADACKRQIELGGAPNRFCSAGAPQQLGTRPTYRPRQHARIAELEIFAVETESLAGPRQLQNLDGLERPPESLCARNAEALELLRAVAQAKSQPEPAAR